MVRREADGQTLYWIQDGLKVEVHPMEYQYGVVQETQDLQISAKLQNNHNKDYYMRELGNMQISVDASRPYSVPAPPLMLVVSDPIMDDYGNVEPGKSSEVPWVPALPTLKFKKT